MRDATWYVRSAIIKRLIVGFGGAFIERAFTANVARVYGGGESGSGRILRLLKEGFRAERLRAVARLCSSEGLPITTVSLVGMFPFETEHNLDMTLELAEELRTMPHVSVDEPNAYNPYPCTECYGQPLASVWASPDSNKGWAKFSRRISFGDTGFSIAYPKKLFARFPQVAEFKENNPS